MSSGIECECVDDDDDDVDELASSSKNEVENKDKLSSWEAFFLKSSSDKFSVARDSRSQASSSESNSEELSCRRQGALG